MYHINDTCLEYHNGKYSEYNITSEFSLTYQIDIIKQVLMGQSGSTSILHYEYSHS